MVNVNSNESLPYSIAIIGPTAVGKTELSLRIAEHFSGEIISVDSMQVYKYMDIGTAKASPEELQRVPHHLIDIVTPDEDYNVTRFVDDALAAAKSIKERGHIAFLVGGTGLYLKGLTDGIFDMESVNSDTRNAFKEKLKKNGKEALYEELLRYDPKSAERIHPNDTQRLLRALEVFKTTGTPWSEHITQQAHAPTLPVCLKIGLMVDRKELYERINQRTQAMIDSGLITEVQNLIDMGYDCQLNPMQSIGYRHVCNYIQGKWSLEQSIELLARDTRRYAKRQLTWFNNDPGVQWFSPEHHDAIFTAIDNGLKNVKTRG